VSEAPVARINVRVSRSSFALDLRRTLTQLSKSVLFSSPSTARSIMSMERMSCSGLEFTSEELSVLSSFGRKSCLQMARSKERIGASIIWSHGIFGAASIAVLHVHVFAGLLFGKNHALLRLNVHMLLPCYVHVLRFCWVHMERIVLVWCC
jgi:hypothetical protein